jgi:hypothetical protein
MKINMTNTMKPMLKIASLAFVVALVLAMGASGNPSSGKHPHYLHALSDLRVARANLQRPDGGELHEQEREAVHEIDKAIDEIKKASIDDGKNLNDHPPIDDHMQWGGRLHRAIELLDSAHRDVAQEEDDPYAQGLQARAIGHIERAHHHVEEAIQLVH